ncbi:hypothetical protein HMPREF9439_01520, partial [Parasutterella excrementihominis YIT 11859]
SIRNNLFYFRDSLYFRVSLISLFASNLQRTPVTSNTVIGSSLTSN